MNARGEGVFMGLMIMGIAVASFVSGFIYGAMFKAVAWVVMQAAKVGGGQ